jgi:uncharacterized protein (TIGR00251 family)
MLFLKRLKQDLQTAKSLTLKVKVTPSAPRSEVFDELSDGTLKVRLQAVPEDGKANKALIKLLEKEFEAEVEILSGEKNTKKIIRLNVPEGL